MAATLPDPGDPQLVPQDSLTDGLGSPWIRLAVLGSSNSGRGGGAKARGGLGSGPLGLSAMPLKGAKAAYRLEVRVSGAGGLRWPRIDPMPQSRYNKLSCSQWSSGHGKSANREIQIKRRFARNSRGRGRRYPCKRSGYHEISFRPNDQLGAELARRHLPSRATASRQGRCTFHSGGSSILRSGRFSNRSSP
jgi:hypothetical protein